MITCIRIDIISLKRQFEYSCLLSSFKCILCWYHREQTRRQKMMQGQIYGGIDGVVGHGLGGSAVMQQSLLPSVNDPGIWKVKCTAGKEMLLIRSILLKAIELKSRGVPVYVKTAFCNSVRGYIYIEALAEPYARDSIVGLRGLFQSSFERIPVQEMTSLLNATVTKKPLKLHQWVRIKRGPLKGDLARIIHLLEGGSRVIFQAVPRPDFTKRESVADKALAGKAKPPKRMFDVEEARKGGFTTFRRDMPGDPKGRTYEFFNNDFYRYVRLSNTCNIIDLCIYCNVVCW